MAAARSSEKSRTPRVASTGSSSVSPKPRRSMASGRKVSGSASIIGCQNSEDDTLPCTNSTGWALGAAPGHREHVDGQAAGRHPFGRDAG